MRSPEGSFSSQQFEGEDYPLDEIAPDDLPVRDISAEEDAWFFPIDARTTDPGEPRQRPTNRPVVEAERFEVVGAPSGFTASPPFPDEHEPTSDVFSSVQHVATELAEPPTQSVLPGLEPDPHFAQDPAPKRLRRPRPASEKRALRAAQFELWPQTGDSGKEA